MTIEDLEHNARKALLCLYLATDREIADAVNESVLAYIDALKEKLAERKIHGKCSCWRCLGCISDPYTDDEIGPENPKVQP